MTVSINGTKVPITWEEERTLEDVMAAIASWVDAQGHRVASVLCDGRAAQSLDPSTPRQSIACFEVETWPVEETSDREKKILQDYIELIVISAERGDTRALADLQIEFAWILPALTRRLCGQVPQPTWDDPQKLAYEAKSWLEDRQGSGMNDILNRLRDWGRLIQQGRDREAMISLGEVSQELAVLSRSGLGKPELWHELNGFLREATEALGTRDFVLVADLLEYEVVPRLQNMVT